MCWHLFIFKRVKRVTTFDNGRRLFRCIPHDPPRHRPIPTITRSPIQRKWPFSINLNRRFKSTVIVCSLRFFQRESTRYFLRNHRRIEITNEEINEIIERNILKLLDVTLRWTVVVIRATWGGIQIYPICYCCY